ncbi:TonB-dependent receptor plug domain-containing protein [bacterium]|nr:TonB-dependent receptor plug domain-containing protein [bacterium]
MASVAFACAAPVFAQTAAETDASATVVITGTRVTIPGVESSSPVFSLGADEIRLQQQPEVEKLIRVLPITIPGDGQNTNNGTVGAATVNLRGLGSQRNLLLLDGQRITPFDINGRVDTQVIPTAMLERIDIVTGGASAVYGSDAMSGAINFILKRNFEGVELNYDYSITGENDGAINNISLTTGANLDDGRGNVMLGVNYAKRESVLLGDRPLGLLGIGTADGGNYQQFLDGRPPTPPPAGCEAPDAAATGGSTTTIPTRVAIAGGPGLGQFRNDGTLGSNCSVFNFNPYNYYQTPQERFGATAVGHYEINQHVDLYSRASFSSTNVVQQIAPSGIFGTTFFTPLANPLIGAQARTAILAAANTGRLAGTVSTTGALPNWRDVNNNGVVDAADDLLISYRRRTLELGPRSSEYDQNWFQFVVGARGEIVNGWNYDVSYSHGESDRSNTSRGYTNVANIEQQINSVDGVTCRGTSDPACVPINLFGGFGTITPAMAAYAGATAIELRNYRQDILVGTVTGSVDQFKTPWADAGLGLSFGAEYREEEGRTTPDECLKLAPTSCLGGAGGNTLPIEGGFSAYEYFGEAILPIVQGMPFAESLDLELGYRTADYDPSGTLESWKYGLSWEPISGLRFRAMQQRANRAPNVGELAAPVTTGLDNATLDPCSIANAANINATLRALCISTGMTNAQVGTVEDIVSGQINGFFGTNLARLPAPESADTTTFGVVWTPSNIGLPFITRPTVTLDYYDIQIDDYINSPPAQGILDGCYVLGDPTQCGLIRRIGGTLTLPGSGLEQFTTNLTYLKAEGVELGVSFGVDLQAYGELSVSFNGNMYLSNEFQAATTLPVQDCKGFYSAACGGNFGTPLPETRWVQRTLWDFEALGQEFQLGYLWRHLDEVTSDVPVFAAFQTIDTYDYLDLTGAWRINDMVKLNAGITNVFEEEPPVVGNEAADTGSNSGNTFPSTYDVLGRVFSIGVNLRF